MGNTGLLTFGSRPQRWVCYLAAHDISQWIEQVIKLSDVW